MRVLSIFTVFLFSGLILSAQDSPLIKLGSPAPALQARYWLKGEPIKKFEKGKVYVLEFWATWCRGCIAALPKFSALAKDYQGRVEFVAVDAHESLALKPKSLEDVRNFLIRMGKQVDVRVAIDDSDRTYDNMITTAGDDSHGMSRTFVIDTDGKLIWSGNPWQLAKVLPSILDNAWDLKTDIALRKEHRRLERLEDSLNYELVEFRDDPYKPVKSPDTLLKRMQGIVDREPALQYSYIMAGFTFRALLKTDMDSAFRYAKAALAANPYEEVAYEAVIHGILEQADNVRIPPELYRLGVLAYKMKLDDFPYPELINVPRCYNNAATMFWRAGDKEQAVKTQKLAIEELKKRKGISKSTMDEFIARLREYQMNMPSESSLVTKFMD